ncbi:glycerophosphodiester phosphodiesterase [Rhodococcus sp. BP-349]|uniref:Glycerophosphoryl diester phosphodiesterase n=1 Tax=Rhodococcoides corynebacterioides TaxID=53972 RepID=A0ABS2KXV4_9NOCA|nr:MULTISPECIES: glycerophosphodiester phosphodiesterase family protein [Rhodococcus]MBM7416759.1 glycerophosphoryl diester phosphodiesterase [Rhodococcus corynebacterioides]MBP1115012.1 glycerophosphoryl diester phosphodiesterase [Rhodococcus sp. PvP016]MBY6539105.1 glycerophosphodiester phosphodiesterase [Rhodococcus sp. BP-363]MBY6544567.1 glycerophosphodiester phosphodiesterase [Rhodococcus sp. BP-369]MBY6563797.1 glycerophosphodiester phosphodiesterase [Rhodococcus sp. BP-370]
MIYSAHEATPLVVAHRGSSGTRPEHTLVAYEQALREGADGVECDVRLTRDGRVVCVHDRRIDRTSSGTGIVSALTYEALSGHDYGTADDPANVLLLSDLIDMVMAWKAKPAKIFIETKHPVRYGGLIENAVLAELHRFGIGRPGSASLSRAVVMSFAPSAVWRVRRSAPMLPTVLLGTASRYIGGGAATTVGATAVGPSIKTLRDHPNLVDHAAAAGRATYCWTVNTEEDVHLCHDLGVRWLATDHPGQALAWLDDSITR